MDDQTVDPNGSVELLQPEQGAEEVVVEAQQDATSTPSDKLTPEHPRFKEVISERNELREQLGALKEQLNEVKSQISQRQAETGVDKLTDEEEAALSKVERLLAQRGWARKEDVTANERITRRAIQLDKLTEKYNGRNGYPVFDQADVLEHAKRNGLPEDNLERAYKDLHYDAIVKIEATKLAKSSNIPSSERPTGADRQFSPQMTPENISKMSTNDWQKNRGTILERMRQAAKAASRFE